MKATPSLVMMLVFLAGCASTPPGKPARVQAVKRPTQPPKAEKAPAAKVAEQKPKESTSEKKGLATQDLELLCQPVPPELIREGTIEQKKDAFFRHWATLDLSEDAATKLGLMKQAGRLEEDTYNWMYDRLSSKTTTCPALKQWTAVWSTPQILKALHNDIGRVVRSHRNQVRACYENLLKRSGKSEGVIKVRFVINGQGLVRSSQVMKSSLTSSDQEFESCILKVIDSMNFTPPQGWVTVKYPFKLKAEKKTKE